MLAERGKLASFVYHYKPLKLAGVESQLLMKLIQVYCKLKICLGNLLGSCPKSTKRAGYATLWRATVRRMKPLGSIPITKGTRTVCSSLSEK